MPGLWIEAGVNLERCYPILLLLPEILCTQLYLRGTVWAEDAYASKETAAHG